LRALEQRPDAVISVRQRGEAARALRRGKVYCRAPSALPSLSAVSRQVIKLSSVNGLLRYVMAQAVITRCLIVASGDTVTKMV
jgi:hypothetical protein